MHLLTASPSTGDGFRDWFVGANGIQHKAKAAKRSLSRLFPTMIPVRSNESEREKAAAISYARSVRALPLRLVTVRKNFDHGVETVVTTYINKVKRYCPFEDVHVKSNPKNTSDVSVQVEAEGERVLKAIAPRDWVVLLDERGLDVTSEQLATMIAEAGDRGSSALVFCIGGPHGHGSQVQKRANISIRLSSMGVDDTSRGEVPPLKYMTFTGTNTEFSTLGQGLTSARWAFIDEA